jgi:hypothetical protein
MRATRVAALLSVLIMSTTVGCETFERFVKGTLERLEYWPGSGSAYYSAKPVGDDYSGPTGTIYPDSKNGSGYANYYYYFHPDESPKSLGYTEGPHYDSDGKTMYYHPDGYRNPGSGGVWANGIKFSGGPGSSSSSGVCAGGYKSPTTDAQLDAYCGAAYAYRCLDGKPLSDPGVQAVCKYYNDIKTASAPSCPYCK